MAKITKERNEEDLAKLHRRIAELEKSEDECKKLERENAKLRKTLEATGEAIFIASADGTITYSNPAIEKLFGYKKGELIGKMPSIFNAGPNPETVTKNMMKTLKQEGHWEGEVHNKRKDDTEFTSYARVCALKDDKGKIINLLSTQHDATEDKQAEEKLNGYRNHLEERTAELQQEIRAHDNVKKELKESVTKLRNVLEETIRAMALTVEKRDLFTAGHQRRVAELASAIAKAMKLPEDIITGVYMAGLLHDIGKISIPAELLMKPSKLNEIELELVRNHPRVAYDILKEIEFPWPLAKISFQHHERMDGSGYPNGLMSKDIALESRIIAVADVVEAMSSARPYRPALGVDKALEEISTKKGLLYDSDVVNTCVKLFKNQGFSFK